MFNLNINFLLLNNLDLLSVGFTVAATFILGFIVFFSNPKSLTNQSFLFFAIITTAWGVVNYLSYQFGSENITLWLFRMVMFFALLQAFSLYLFFKAFPKTDLVFSKRFYFITLPIIVATAFLTLTPLLFSDIEGVSKAGTVANVSMGPGLFLFAIVAISLVFRGIFIFLKKLKENPAERGAYAQILVGALISFSLIILFNFVFATFYNNPRFIPLGALFFFPFVLFTSYAILKHKIFNIKVGGVAVLIFTLSAVIFTEIVITDTNFLKIYKSTELALVLFVGILLIKGVLREVEQREQIQELATELELANKEQQNLIHFITHQVKGFLSKSRNIFAGLMEGDYGDISEETQMVVQEGFKSDTKAVETVQQILQASNLRKGTVEMQKKEVDLRSLVQEEVKKQKQVADKKDLKLTASIPEEAVTVQGDGSLLEHVVHNLIDNAVKYTPHGSVEVSLKKDSQKIRFSVKDTGVGITKEDMKRLFTEGGRGENSTKVNVESTGYGLYIVKNIVEKHGGKVWAESAGEEKGSEFIVELPVNK